MKARPQILTIAGFDPSAGAGILADIKTFEKLRCYGFAVQTANTVQTENTFEEPNWIPVEIILKQLSELLRLRQFKWVKIGLIESMSVLKEIIDQLKQFGNPKIIWDPVLRTSSGFDFKHDLRMVKQILRDVYLVTPNKDEAQSLILSDKLRAESGELELATKKMSESCKIMVTSDGDDVLFENGEIRNYKAKFGAYWEKHGSGCVLSSAITSNLALGHPLHKSILRSKRYVEHYLASNQGMLGYHS
ncbi:hydroxymethylpyrimidine/phosphomethylpyrimidine kinase [Crocinitomix catalasitica]|nr:hydroxymethylpyrimidine/phosphomethylpyrimidine kinase [Crocinitomix catalasitica]